jgi:hypothetical protein
MKYLKLWEQFKAINETGEWDKDVDLQFVKDNPGADDEFSLTIKDMAERLDDLKELLNNPEIFLIKDIRGFDVYQGAYAIVSINGRNYKVWSVGENPDNFWIEDYIIDNTSEKGLRSGFEGDIYEISDMLNSK